MGNTDERDAADFAKYQRRLSEEPSLRPVIDAPIRVAQDLAPARQILKELREARPEDASQIRVGVVYEDDYVFVLREAVRFPSGAPGTYVRFIHKPVDTQGVVVLPVLPSGELVLVRHFRHATQAWHLEAPRGFGHPGCTRRVSAQKELREELGVDAVHMVELGSHYPDSGLLASKVSLWLAHILDIHSVDGEEGIDGWHACSDIDALISAGQLTDGPTLAAITIARAKGVL